VLVAETCPLSLPGAAVVLAGIANETSRFTGLPLHWAPATHGDDMTIAG
jgi:hypothetical protein